VEFTLSDSELTDTHVITIGGNGADTVDKDLQRASSSKFSFDGEIGTNAPLCMSIPIQVCIHPCDTMVPIEAEQLACLEPRLTMRQKLPL
jgi:hypothetical protein